MNPQSKPIEIFCGTGGVGKTTLSTSRALFLANQGKKVLLITIDPAKRLKDILKLDESSAGIVQRIPLELFQSAKGSLGPSTGMLEALLISPMTTLERIIDGQHGQKGEQAIRNRILNILFKPNGGMNEFMGLLEVHHYTQSQKYDNIILDTPPGKQFVEFLESCGKIHDFFDKSFIEIFHVLEKGMNENTKRPIPRVFKKILSSGIRKLLDYLEKFTGMTFVTEFIEAVDAIYKLKKPFLETLAFQEHLKDPAFSNWYLVTSIDHDKIIDALNFRMEVQKFFHDHSFVVLNKCQEGYWEQWERETGAKISPYLQRLKSSMVERERKIKMTARKNFENVLTFQEILNPSVLDQVVDLAHQWNSYK